MKRRETLIWGFAATIILTTIMRGSQFLGLTRVDLPLMLGTMVTARRDRAKIYGFLLHLMNGWIFSSIYAVAFESLRRSTWWIGATIGVVHGLFVLVVGMPALPGLHPRMADDADGPDPTRDLQPPGFMAVNYGRQTGIATMLSHMVFGAILGAFYQAGRR